MLAHPQKKGRSYLIPLCLVLSAVFGLIAFMSTLGAPALVKNEPVQMAVVKNPEPKTETYIPDIPDFHGMCMKTTEILKTGVAKVSYGPGTFPMTQDELTWCVDPTPKPEGAIVVTTSDPHDPLEAADAAILKERADDGLNPQPATN